VLLRLVRGRLASIPTKLWPLSVLFHNPLL